MNDRIDAVLVDTSVYHKKQCDFEGITNSIIPMLLQLLRANNIKLLSHPILMREIKKHIGQSELISRINNFQSALRKYNKQLQMIGTSAEELNQKLEALNTLFHAGHGKWLLYTVRRTAVFTLLCEKNAFQNCRERK